MSFKDKIVIITGGASGIGAATAEAFCKEGAKVVVADLSDSGKHFCDQLNQQGFQSAFFKIDVTDIGQNRALIAFTIETFGGLDIVFANAGVASDTGPADKTSFEAWKLCVDVNLNAVFTLDKLAIEYWLEKGQKGVIVNCGSIHSWVGKSGISGYSATKGAVKLLTQTLAIDYAAKGIRVNAVSPGYIDTPFLSQVPKDVMDEIIKAHPIGRLGRAEEVANAVLFLASEKASFINGISLLVDGGYVAQ